MSRRANPLLLQVVADQTDERAHPVALRRERTDAGGHERGSRHRAHRRGDGPEHGRYVQMVTRDGILDGFVSVGMPRTAAELTLLYQRGSELRMDRSLLLRFDGPDFEPAAGANALAPDATVCWCNGITVGAIADSIGGGQTTVACIETATRAGTGCGGCKGRILEVLERFAS